MRVAYIYVWLIYLQTASNTHFRRCNTNHKMYVAYIYPRVHVCIDLQTTSNTHACAVVTLIIHMCETHIYVWCIYLTYKRLQTRILAVVTLIIHMCENAHIRVWCIYRTYKQHQTRIRAVVTLIIHMCETHIYVCAVYI